MIRALKTLDSGCNCLPAQAIANYDSAFTRLFHIISFLGEPSTHLENHRFVDALWRLLGSLTLSWVSLFSPHSRCHHCSLLSDLLGYRCCLLNAAGTTKKLRYQTLTLFLCCRIICNFRKQSIKVRQAFPRLHEA